MATSQQYGAFVLTNYIWEIQQVEQLPIDPNLKLLLVRLYQNINAISLVLNIKDTGMYQRSELVNGQLFFSNPLNNSSTVASPAERQVLRKGFLWPTALPNAGTQSIPHGIICTAKTTFTRIYGAASDTAGFNYIPLPYASPTLVNNIELNCDGTKINIITGSNRSNFNVTYIILEYLQS
jgi:hypothetical protein